MWRFVLACIVGWFFPGFALAQIAVEDGIVAGLIEVCETPSATFEETSAALTALQSGYQREADDMFGQVVRRPQTSAIHPRQTWAARFGEIVSYAELRPADSEQGQIADFALYNADGEIVRALLRAYFGASRDLGSSPANQRLITEIYRWTPSPEVRSLRGTVLVLYDPEANGIRVICNLPRRD